MSDGIIIIGAGGHAKVIADIILTRGEPFFGFLDDSATGKVLGYPVLGSLKDIDKYQDSCSFIIGIGDNKIRKNISETNKVHWHTAIHPDASIAREVEIGNGSVIMARVTINPSVRIGRHCIINTGAVVEHDNTIGDYVHISPNATLCGTTTIGTLTQIGAGATVKNNISVCANCMIGAGSVVVNNVTEPGTYMGVPAIQYQKQDI